MGHDAANPAPPTTTREGLAAPATHRRGTARRGLVPQWFVVLTILLVASVVVERTKSPPVPVSAARTTVESWHLNRT